jgi:signal peptidase
MMKEKKENKILDIIFTIIKLICVVILILLIIALAMQRFSNNENAIGGIRIFNVATGSMIPKYEVGDILIVKEVDTNELEVGDDITYLGKVSTFAGRVVTHQIIQIEESETGEKIFHTKGIANDTEDPEITADQIYGKVIYKCVVLSLLTKLMNNMAAFYIVVFIPLGILIFLQIKDRIDEKRLEDSDEDSDEDEDNK